MVKFKITQKNLGLGILLIPLGVLLLFAFGETFSGDFSGLGHLLQAAPLIALAALAWKKPFIGGMILASLSLILGILYALNFHFPLTTIFIAELLLFLPPFASGILFMISSRNN